MNSKSTLVGRYIIILTALVLSSSFSTQAQSILPAQAVSPKLKFVQPMLVSGIAGQKDAIYKFSNVVADVDAFVKIDELINGAILVNIDDSTLGYYDAWQPTIGGPITGTSYIEWEISFKTTFGSDYTFPLMDLSAIDIDGDNVRVREFMDMSGCSSYDVPTLFPSLLSISNVTNDEIHVLGPVANRTGIDTVSLDTRINFHFINQSMIKVSIGSQIDNNGTSGNIATDRYNSLYFKSISNFINTLGVRFESFDAYAINNNEVNLTWKTANETNNDHFEVERSFDQKYFKTVGLVFGPEVNTSGSHKYSFNDKATGLSSHKVIYYRLKQIDVDGKFTYSVVKIVRFNSISNTILQVSPNPYMETLNVNFISNENDKAEVRMINVKGQVIVAKQFIVSKGYNNLQLKHLAAQANGLYLITVIINGNVVKTQKVIKQ